ncbi:MAG: hypothetical protein Q4F13_06895 [Pseudomonadota bacterium]|nr:hypothetical protein [Pseudomonadota bacterium]
MTATTYIELTQPHRHAGRDYPAGATLGLPAHKAAWLIGLGRAREAPPAPVPTPATPAKKAKD